LQEYGYRQDDKDWVKVKRMDTHVTGYFPRNYLKIMESKPDVREQWMESSYRFQTQKITVIFECVALFDYTATLEDELNFHANDVINVVNQDEAGWWMGELNGKIGLFPSNFVERKDKSAELPAKTAQKQNFPCILL
jgi:hypothetical protein